MYLTWHLYWMPRQVTMNGDYNWISVEASRLPGIHGYVMDLRHGQEHAWLRKKYADREGRWPLHYPHYQLSEYFPYIEKSWMWLPYTPDPY